MPLSDEDMCKMFGPSSCAPDEMQKIKPKTYFIIAYCTPDKKHRCFGHYTTYRAAKQALELQWKDMEECYYDSFFIESMEEGLFKISSIVDYYEIENPERNLIKKDLPYHLKTLVNWSIG